MAILTLDDRDPSIVYSGGWDQADSSFEYDRTTAWTDVAGSTAKLTFQGSSVGVFGTISSKDRNSIAPVSSYSIDGGAPVKFHAVQELKTQYSQLFFLSPLIPSGTHTLTITNDLVSDPLFLDFIQVLTNTDPSTSFLPVTSASSSSSSFSSTSASSSSSTSSSVSTTSSLTAAGQFTPSITSSQSSSTPFLATADNASSPSGSPAASGVGATKSSNAGALAGGIIAAIIAVILIVFSIIFWRRKQKRRNSFSDFMSDNSVSFWPPVNGASSKSTPSAQPFVLGAPPPPRSTRPIMTQAESTASYPASYPYSQPRYPGGYIPGATYHNSPYTNPAPAASVYTVASSNENSYYNQSQSHSQHQTHGYPSRAYVPPSQLINNPTHHTG